MPLGTSPGPSFPSRTPAYRSSSTRSPDDHIAKQYALAASNTIGDVVWCYNNGTGEAVRKGVPKALDDIVAAEKFDLAVWRSMIAAFRWEGKLYGVPNHGHFGTNIWYLTRTCSRRQGRRCPRLVGRSRTSWRPAKRSPKSPMSGECGPTVAAVSMCPNTCAPLGVTRTAPMAPSRCSTRMAPRRRSSGCMTSTPNKVDPCICGDQTRDNFVAGKVGAYWTPGYAASSAHQGLEVQVGRRGGAQGSGRSAGSQASVPPSA